MKSKDGITRICLWSGPRNISTTLMYSFAQRDDVVVVDEPLYASYLCNTNAKDYHPGASEIIAKIFLYQMMKIDLFKLNGKLAENHLF